MYFAWGVIQVAVRAPLPSLHGWKLRLERNGVPGEARRQRQQYLCDAPRREAAGSVFTVQLDIPVHDAHAVHRPASDNPLGIQCPA
jgi:hypothetical protein